MSSLVLDLQRELMKDNCDILTILRKAHLIASKLNLEEFDLWIQHELNGYSECTREQIPDYRIVKGVLKAHNPYNGWIPAQFADNETERMICEQKLHFSIAELQNLYEQSDTGYVIYQFNAELTDIIASIFKSPFPMQYALHISSHLLISIVEKVKNYLLEWTINLESNGVIGENMIFNDNEKDKAKNMPQQINNYYGTVINGNVSGSQVVSGNDNDVTYNANAVSNAVTEIRESLEKEEISSEDKESALELLDEISSKLEQNKKPGIIKSALIGLKDFVISAGADLTAALIAAKIQGLF